MEAQQPEHFQCDRQKSSTLAKLPVELLYLIVARLDTPSILAVRLTCNLALDWALPSFRKLLKSRKYFLHPYSFNLLEELSTSPFAECVERIVIGTETFNDTFHLTAAEYSTTLTSTFQRFAHLQAVEIRDSVPWSAEGYYHDDFLMDDVGMYSFTDAFRRYGNHHNPYEDQYNSRWGEEEDNLHSQGFRRVSAGYKTLAFRKPPSIYSWDRLHHPYPNAQLGELFTATLQACAVAKTAGVNVTDFRVALMYQWGIPDDYLAGFSGGDRSEQEQFLSSLEVLHLDTHNTRGIGPRSSIWPFISACTSLKWLRVVFGSGALGSTEVQSFMTYFSEMGERSPLNRLDLGRVDIDGSALTGLILKFRPKILNVWFGTVRESRLDTDDDREGGWGTVLRDVAGVVGHVRLVRGYQTYGTERDMKQVRLVEGGGLSTLPDVGHGYIHLSPDSVEAVVRDMVISPLS